jgi:LysM repeat protein
VLLRRTSAATCAAALLALTGCREIPTPTFEASVNEEVSVTDPNHDVDPAIRGKLDSIDGLLDGIRALLDSRTPTDPDPEPDGFYTVQPGDTLSAIAARTGVTVDELAGWNDIGDPNQISVGQVLRLTAPDPDPAPEPDPAPPAPEPDPAPDPAPGKMLYSTDFSDWSGVYTDSGRFQQTGRGNLALVDGAARARITGSSSGTARAEIIPRFQALREGNEYWFGLRTRLSQSYPAGSTWQLIAQWKNDGTGSPPVQLAAQGGRYTLVGHNSGGGVAYRHDLGIAPGGPIRVGEWEKWAIRIRFSSSASSGLVEVWRNGEQVLAPTARPTLYSGRTSYAKVGYYRDEGIGADSWVEHDYYRIGTSRGAVS